MEKQGSGGINMKRYFKIVYPIVLIAVAMGFLLSITYQSLEKRLLQAAEMEENLTLKSLFPYAGTFEKKEIENTLYYEAKDSEGKTIGYIFKTSNKGYGGPVEAMVAITNGFVANIKILSAAKETPGLGTKATKEEWLSQFFGKTYKDIPQTKPEFKEKGLDAVSGATLTSLAVARDISDAFKIYKKLGYIVEEVDLDSQTHATENTNSGGGK
jgi:electron transport complex protein RnfG